MTKSDTKTSSENSTAFKETKKKRTAVVVVHGQGEQRPMETLRGIVRGLFPGKIESGKNFWVVPDKVAGLHDLQRITMKTNGELRTDFFELYFADLLDGRPISNLFRWIRRLQKASHKDVALNFRFVFFVLKGFMLLATACAAISLVFLNKLFAEDWWAYLCGEDKAQAGVAILVAGLVGFFLAKVRNHNALRAAGFLALLAIVAYSVWVILESNIPAILVLVVLGLSVLVVRFVNPYFGDAAAYLSAYPETVDVRSKVRARGKKLLQALHEDDRYDEIVILAHSLGSVVAYDLLHIMWNEIGPASKKQISKKEKGAFENLDRLANTLDTAAKIMEAAGTKDQAEIDAFSQAQKEFRAAQSEVFEVLKGHKSNPSWKITNFVTFGSPLTHAKFLIADNSEHFEQNKRERLMSTCPPSDVKGAPSSIFGNSDSGFRVHNAAVFSAVRWTNLHDVLNPIVFWSGDLISGPVAGTKMFGSGIVDVEARIPKRWYRAFTHNAYWQDLSDLNKSNEHLNKFREAADLGLEPMPEEQEQEKLTDIE